MPDSSLPLVTAQRFHLLRKFRLRVCRLHFPRGCPLRFYVWPALLLLLAGAPNWPTYASPSTSAPAPAPATVPAPAASTSAKASSTSALTPLKAHSAPAASTPPRVTPPGSSAVGLGAIAQGASGLREPFWQALWPQGAPGAKGSAPSDQPALLVFPLGNLPVTSPSVADSVSEVHTPVAKLHRPGRPGFLICPGGAYGMLAWEKEGVQVARWLNDRGVFAAVLRYRLGPVYRHPAPYLDGQRGMRWLRAHAHEYGLDPHRIGMVGFSAGGHLTATVATHADSGLSAPLDFVDRQSCRPDLQVLIYPVISMDPSLTHAASRINLLGRNPAPEALAFLSAEKNAQAGDPPAFIIHARTDPIVSFANSEAYYNALAHARVPVEFHAYAQGGHAFGLGLGLSPKPRIQNLETHSPLAATGNSASLRSSAPPMAASHSTASQMADSRTAQAPAADSDSRMIEHAEAPDQWPQAFQAWLASRGWMSPGS